MLALPEAPYAQIVAFFDISKSFLAHNEILS